MVFTLGALKNFEKFAAVFFFKKASGPQACKFTKKRIKMKLARSFFTEQLR